jgi:hypothetical protein
VTDGWWIDLLDADPAPWLLAADEPAARWVTLTRVLGRADDDPEVVAARAAVLVDAATEDLLGRLGDWEAGDAIGGHNSPRYLPNLLVLLDEMGVWRGDDARLEAALEAMLRRQAGDGRFLSFTSWRGMDAPVWAALPCDAHALAEALVRHGAAGDPRVRAALGHIGAALTDTAEGPGWLCVPDPAVPFRGPGRKADVCPQVTAEALRVFARIPVAERPAGLLEAARTLLGVWRERGAQRPYMFGHGAQFKAGKWPATWYCALTVLDALGAYPELWTGAAAPSDRRAVAELCACLIAYAVSPDGTVTPRSCYKGFEQQSFGQKKRPSPFATARVLAVLAPFAGLAGDIRVVDPSALGSAKGGTGAPVPPRTGR